MADKTQVTRVVYFKGKNAAGKDVQNETVSMYAIDAHNAVSFHPDEYSYEPWDGSEGANQPNGEPRAVIPNNWVDLRPSERIDLARQLGAKDIRSGAAADEFINGYLVDRANYGVAEPAPDTSRPATGEKNPVVQAPVTVVPPPPLGPAENNPKL